MVNYSLNIFGKDIDEVTFDDLSNFFIDQKLESDTLEFKSFPPQANFDNLMGKILKTICGFLNASGGLLILGAPVKTVVGNVDYFQGNLTPVNIQKSVDWFINKICSSISPMPINILVKIIPIGDTFVYLFQVQQSNYKPHQLEHIYYMRLDGQTKPAPHYVVQALMRQVTYPDIRATIRINPFFEHAGETLSKMSIAIFNFSQLQNEENYNYMVTLSGGAKLFGWQANQFGDKIHIGLDGAQIIHKAISESLHFGIPYAKSYIISIPAVFDEIKIMLTFGGKYSPSKVCFYRLNFENLNFENPQENITILKDNELFEAKQTIDEALAFFRNNEVI